MEISHKKLHGILAWELRNFNLQIAGMRNFDLCQQALQNAGGTWPNTVTFDAHSPYVGTFAWVYQELSKGQGSAMSLLTPDVRIQGGWGFNPYWKIYYSTGSLLRSKDEMTPVEAGDTAKNPFFLPFILSDLHDPAKGSITAERFWHRNYTLTQGIPAISFAAGGNLINHFEIDGRNIDLMLLKDNEAWPYERPTISAGDNRRRWFHSDAKDVALRYNYKLFEDWISKGKLK